MFVEITFAFGVCRTEQDSRRAQFIRHDLKMAESVRAVSEFHRATFVGGNVHRIFVAVVTFQNAEREAALFQIVNSLNPPRSVMRASQRGQKHCRQKRDDGDDDEQRDQSKTLFGRIIGSEVHDGTMNARR